MQNSTSYIIKYVCITTAEYLCMFYGEQRTFDIYAATTSMRSVLLFCGCHIRTDTMLIPLSFRWVWKARPRASLCML